MTLTSRTEAMLLLTAPLGRPDTNEARPLTAREWDRLSRFLEERGACPGRLLEGDLESVLPDWQDRVISRERLTSLLRRRAALRLALEKWERVGIWVMTRLDSDYPKRIVEKLGALSPPMFFGSGARTLVDQGGLAIVGARHADDEELAFARCAAERAATQDVCVVSGGARGVDEVAMLGAIGAGGSAIGVLADGLVRATTSSKYRKSLMEGNLALITSFHPGAGFHVGRAMARNRFIYCVAKAAIVVAATEGQGGTWSGAVENLDRGWTKVWVRRTTPVRTSNRALLARGAQELPEGDLQPKLLLDVPAAAAEKPLRTTTPHPTQTSLPFGTEPPPRLQGAGAPTSEGVRGRGDAAARSPSAGGSAAVRSCDLDPYEQFLVDLARTTRDEPALLDELQKRLDLPRQRLVAWLTRATKEGRARRIEVGRQPKRYQAIVRGGEFASASARPRNEA